MGEVIKISAFAILGVMAALTIKREKPGYGFLMGLALGFMVLGICIKRILRVSELFYELMEGLGTGSQQLEILVKVLGITYVCELSAGICRDEGYGFLASQLETLGKLSVMLSGMTILTALMEQIFSLTLWK